MPILPDLVTLAVAASELAQSLPPDTSALQASVSAASRAVRRYCARDFSLTGYDELYDGRGYSELVLRQYPVASVSRLAVNPLAVLTVANADPAANQRALAALATTGDADAGLTTLGLTLTRWASGVRTAATLFWGAPDGVGFAAVAGGTGGSLTPGTYLVSYALAAGGNESVRSPDVAATVASGQTIALTLPAPPAWADGYHVYLSTAGGNSGTETRQNGSSPVNATSYTIATLVSGVAPATQGNLTVQALAASVVALGANWTAAVLSGYGLWASADLRAAQGVQSALAPAAGAQLNVHASDLAAWTLDAPTGRLRLDAQGYDPVFSLMGVGGSSLASFPPGFQNVRVAYTAGYGTIPADVRQAVLVAAQAYLYDLQTVKVFKAESAKDWSATLADRPFGLPVEAKRLLDSGGWRSYRTR